MTKRLRASLIAVLGVALAVCLLFGALQFLPKHASAETAENVSHATVAVHDPSIVLAYEGEDGKAYPDKQTAETNGGGSYTKTYYVFGTQLAFAKSTDLVNWTPFETNLHIPENLTAMLTKEAAYSGNSGNPEKLKGNCWAPDVIWNKTMQKWCMYLSVNGEHQKSVIVLLVADDLDGAWSYVGGVVYSRITDSNIGSTDYQKATGKTTVDPKYAVYRNSEDNLLYGVNAIDAAVTYDDEGNLWMVYGSWFGGIYMLRLDPETGLRDYDYTYKNEVRDGSGGDITNDTFTQSSHPDTFKVVSDEYLGIHIAGGHHSPVGGEGSYIEKIGQYYYLFLSYGGYAPDGGYNMRVFRSENITGPYVDAAGRAAIFSNVYPNGDTEPNDSTGNRLMTGYTWSWWDFSYVAQGHNSAFVDDDGKAYLIYHNKYMDGSVFHVMKVHELLVKEDGWPVVSPFEANKSDEVVTGEDNTAIAGDYGVLLMKKDNGAYGNPVTEQKYTLTADGNITGAETGSWGYDAESGKITLTLGATTVKGYLLRQTIEGTNISTTAFTAIDSAASLTYWGYKYPDATQAGQYVADEYALPDAMGENVTFPDVTIWGTTLNYAKEGNNITVKAGGTTVAQQALTETENFLEYDKVDVNQKFFKVDSSAGISITFDYKNYQDDWTEVLAGDNFRINLSVLERAVGGKWGSIFESAAGGIHTAFFGSGRATISFNTDGTIAFYRDGKLQMRFGAHLTYNDVDAGTVQDLCNDVINAFKAGKVKATYPMENVVIAEAVGEGSVYDAVPYLTLTDSSIEMYGTVKDSASGTAIPAVSNAETNGFAISFDLTEAFQETPIVTDGLNGDWRSVVIGAGSYNITLPNLDSYGANQQNKFPLAENLKNGGAWNSFLGTTCFVTVSVSKTEGVKFYKDGLLVIEYPYSDTYVKGFVDAILPIVQQSGFTALAGSGTEIVHGENLIVSSALTDTQAQSIYADYQKAELTPAEPTREVLNIDNGYYTVVWNPATTMVNTATPNGGAAGNGWWSGECGATTLPKGNYAVQMRYYRAHNFLDAVIQINDVAGAKWGTFAAFSTLSGDGNDWPNDFQTGGSYVIYENGVKSQNQTLFKPSESASWDAKQWIGNYTITFLHYDTTLYVVCDFTRDETNERYTVEYKFAGISGDVLVQISGYCCDIGGTLVTSESGSVLEKHSLTNVPKEDATCTEPGHYEYWECSDCGKKFKDSEGNEEYPEGGEIIQATGHSLQKHDAKDATCTEKGNKEYWECSKCHAKFSAQTGGEEYTSEDQYVIQPSGHSLQKHDAKDATCEAEGNKAYWECSKCNKYFSSDTEPDSHVVENGWWITQKVNHTLKKTEAKDANCTEDGNDAYWQCEVCHKYFDSEDDTSPDSEPIEEGSWVKKATGHTDKFTLKEGSQATAEKHKHIVVCENPNCPGVEEDCKWNVQDNRTSCDEPGEATYTCEVCRFSYTEPLKAGEHSWGNGEVKKEATCTEEGEMEYSCSKCGQTKTETIEKLAHELVKEAAKDATCTEDGNYEYWECSVCHKMFKDNGGNEEYPQNGQIIPASGHALEKKEAKAATCTEAGNNEYWECSKCHKKFTAQTDGEEITDDSYILQATGHSLTKHEAHAATCTEAGNNEYWECSKCHKKFTAQTGGEEITDDSYILQATGHSLTKHEAHAATCTENGNSEYWDCSKCNKYFSSDTNPDEHVIAQGAWITDKLAHTLTEHARVAATCTQAGTEAYWECSACHKKFTAQTGGTEIAEATAIPALGHDWEEWTTGADGTETRACNRCDATETRNNDEVAAFHTAVGAIAGATTAQTKLAAIKTALTAYNALSAVEKLAVATDYATLESAIAAYNTVAEATNAAYNTAADIAVRVLSTTLAALSALAAVWVILKRGL